jgi:hypothetical protein
MSTPNLALIGLAAADCSLKAAPYGIDQEAPSLGSGAPAGIRKPTDETFIFADSPRTLFYSPPDVLLPLLSRTSAVASKSRAMAEVTFSAQSPP